MTCRAGRWHEVGFLALALLLAAELPAGVWAARVSTQSWIDAAAACASETAFGLVMLLQVPFAYGVLGISSWLLARVGLPHGGGNYALVAGLQSALRGAAYGACTLGLMWWFRAIPAPVHYNGYLGEPSRWVFIAGVVLGGFSAICEEVYFRGLLYRLFRRQAGVRTAVALNASLFTGMHLLEYRGLIHLVVVLGLGVICCRYAERDDGWYGAGVFHALMNMTYYGLANVHVLFGRGA